jgi:hypothetical protein
MQDDYKSLMYLLVNLSSGSLPWQGQVTEEDDKNKEHNLILESKRNITE